MNTSRNSISPVTLDAATLATAIQPLEHGPVSCHLTDTTFTIEWSDGDVVYASRLHLTRTGDGSFPTAFAVDVSFLKALLTAAPTLQPATLLISIDPTAATGARLCVQYLQATAEIPIFIIPYRAISFAVEGPAVHPASIRSAISCLLPFCHPNKRHEKHAIQFSELGAFAGDDDHARRALTSPTPFSFRLKKDTARTASRMLSSMTGKSTHTFNNATLSIASENTLVQVSTIPTLDDRMPTFDYHAHATFDEVELGSAILKITKQASKGEHLHVQLDRSVLTISAPVLPAGEWATIRVQASIVELGDTEGRSILVECQALKRAAHAMMKAPVRLSMAKKIVHLSQALPEDGRSMGTYLAEPVDS